MSGSRCKELKRLWQVGSGRPVYLRGGVTVYADLKPIGEVSEWRRLKKAYRERSI